MFMYLNIVWRCMIMSNLLEEFFKRMLEFFPASLFEYEKHIRDNKKRLDTIVIEDILMPKLINLLEKGEDDDLLMKIFDYFEEIASCDDAYLLNIFSITVLEMLGNDRYILKSAQKYMGERTRKMQIDADRDLGRPV